MDLPVICVKDFIVGHKYKLLITGDEFTVINKFYPKEQHGNEGFKIRFNNGNEQDIYIGRSLHAKDITGDLLV